MRRGFSSQFSSSSAGQGGGVSTELRKAPTPTPTVSGAPLSMKRVIYEGLTVCPTLQASSQPLKAPAMGVEAEAQRRDTICSLLAAT